MRYVRNKHNFNPRFRVGSDTLVTLEFIPFIYFNPRFRAGSDSKYLQKLYHKAFFIIIFTQ
ncbi:hypothetical protein acsn021_18110 [Anaerocolumna cellulosilytica]|uniref:Uncharacterized protein n=1 Tax=Anaerocolumna cellulosilytica TaxID=433286 RepID=A0A6S6R442_9FIRM|nr:hypothetical protein acsn021_18110 [Anaerocolumna cellulosilytica]